MGDDEIDAINFRLSQMGRSVAERFQNFKNSFSDANTNLNPFMNQDLKTAWANEHFIAYDITEPGQGQNNQKLKQRYHNQGWILKQSLVLEKMGLI
jgi:hypothetical protein